PKTNLLPFSLSKALQNTVLSPIGELSRIDTANFMNQSFPLRSKFGLSQSDHLCANHKRVPVIFLSQPAPVFKLLGQRGKSLGRVCRIPVSAPGAIFNINIDAQIGMKPETLGIVKNA